MDSVRSFARELQSNYGLLVTGDGGELVKLPQLPADLNGVERTAKLTLSPSGTLSGDFVEQRNGDNGTQQRASLKSVAKDADRIKFLESLISHSLPTFKSRRRVWSTSTRPTSRSATNILSLRRTTQKRLATYC